MSTELDSGLSFGLVQTGSRRTDAGKSHSCEQPTSRPSSPSAQTTSVQAGSRETMRGFGMVRKRIIRAAGRWPAQGCRRGRTVRESVVKLRQKPAGLPCWTYSYSYSYSQAQAAQEV